MNADGPISVRFNLFTTFTLRDESATCGLQLCTTISDRFLIRVRSDQIFVVLVGSAVCGVSVGLDLENFP